MPCQSPPQSRPDAPHIRAVRFFPRDGAADPDPERERLPRLEVSEVTYHRWKSQYGGMKADEARRLKELEIENARLKRAVADLTLDNQILKEANDYLGKPRRPHGGGAS